MIGTIISWLTSLIANVKFGISSILLVIISVISSTGYFGVFFLMVLESACIPVPSEIIMPFSGFLVWQGQFGLWGVVFWGTFGNLVGSIIAYAVGYYGGRPLIEKYGKYVFISSRDLTRAHNWLEKYGSGAVFLSRLLPAVRTFISLPAGIAGMNLKKFCVYTFVGSFIWSYFLTYAGVIMGENWSGLRAYFERFDYLIVAVFILAVTWWIWRHITSNRQQAV